MRQGRRDRSAQGRHWWLMLLAAGVASCAAPPPPTSAPPPPRAAETDSPDAVAEGRGTVIDAHTGGATLGLRDPPAREATIAVAGPPPARAHAAGATARPALCDLTGTRLPADICADLREQNGLTRAGIDAAPTSLRMKLHETITYSYSIGAAGSDAAVRANVASGTAPVASGSVALGRFNYARLSGDGGITVKPLDDEVQDTRANPTPTWRWALTADAAGAHRLKLEAGVELRADGTAPVRLGENAKRIDVAVAVAAIDKVREAADTADTMLGISTGLLEKLGLFFGAVGGALVAYRALRKRPAPAPDA